MRSATTPSFLPYLLHSALVLLLLAGVWRGVLPLGICLAGLLVLVWLPRLWPALPAILAPHALVYAESEQPLLAPDGFELLRSDKAASVHYHLLQFAALRK